jgi:hypothetical protein
VFELIPDSEFASVLPRSLIHDYFHWYSTKTHVVEFRPLSDRWTPNLEKNWSTVTQLNGGLAISRQQEFGVRQFLVSPNHALSRAIHNVFSTLEQNLVDLFISFNYEYSTNCGPQPLSIFLPRYNLTFAVTDQGELDCLSHRGFIVDSNEDVGTLYGLYSKLVLCRPCKIGRERKLIVPIGSITPSSTGANHPAVSIDVPGDAVSVGYRVYEVDDLLGRLREATFSDRLYRLYLHALTSHQLPDPLTKRTGTEEALEGLKQASSFSFQTLDDGDVALLQRLGQLTPRRSLYSRQTKTMQTVQRHIPLPPTLEHHDFATIIQKIWSYWLSIRVLYPEFQGKRRDSDDEEFLSGYRTEEQEQLTRRAATRHLFYAPLEGGPPSSRANDMDYTPRDCMGESGSGDRESVAFGMAKLVQEWPTNLDVTVELRSDIEGWCGVEARQAKLTLDYSGVWVEASLRTVWRSLYDLCRVARKETDQSKLTFLLGTLAYLHPNERHIHSTLLAFATSPQITQLASPDSGDLDFSYGEAPTESKLRSFVTSNAFQFEQSSEYAKLDRVEWTAELDTSFRSQYASRRQQQINECVAVLFQLRYQDHVSPSPTFSFNLIEVASLLSRVNDTLIHCYQNR